MSYIHVTRVTRILVYVCMDRISQDASELTIVEQRHDLHSLHLHSLFLLIKYILSWSNHFIDLFPTNVLFYTLILYVI